MSAYIESLVHIGESIYLVSSSGDLEQKPLVLSLRSAAASSSPAQIVCGRLIATRGLCCAELWEIDKTTVAKYYSILGLYWG